MFFIPQFVVRVVTNKTTSLRSLIRKREKWKGYLQYLQK